jgi:hypothetical protein
MNDMTKRARGFIGFFFLVALIVGLGLQPLAAQVTIPEGSTINSAFLNVYVGYASNMPVTVHRITAEWAEYVVTYANFMNNYASAAEGGFTTDTVGWKQVELTSLVQAWAAGIFPNYGIAMIESVPGLEGTPYWSSEAPDPTLRPRLVIGYTPPGGTLKYVTVQRPEGSAGYVADSWISGLYTTLQNGGDPNLLTWFTNGFMKYSLIRFNFAFVPFGPGTGTPGYWMNHPEAWPANQILIGNIIYPKANAIALMKMAVMKDMTYVMFASLVAAKLNVAIGNASGCIAETIVTADVWMTAYPVGSGVAAGGISSPWRIGEPLYKMLDSYNNGLLCAPHRN